MPLETGDFICDLVETNPPGTDNVSQGDDHLRLIKHVLVTQFPNLCGEAVTATADQLNNAGLTGMPRITTYTTPAGGQTHTFDTEKSWYRIYITGGGGGGGSPSDVGGFGAGTAIKVAAITSPTATYTLGAGGLANAGNGAASTWDDGTIQCSGLGGPGSPVGDSEIGGDATGGDINIRGGGPDLSETGMGGASYWSSGTNSTTVPNHTYGAGGRGTKQGPANPGSDGILVIEEY